MKFGEMNGFEITPLILTNPDKDYIYTCTLDNASVIDSDFIFIPITSQLNEPVADLLESAMRNPHCKGFVINNSALAQDKFKTLFHLLMNKYYLKAEAVFLVKNIYNFACYLAVLNLQKYGTKVITIAGSHETSLLRDALTKQFQENHTNILANMNYWSCWQKIIENLLLLNENIEYAIIEAIPEKKGLMGLAAKYSNTRIIFSNSELFKTSIYPDLLDLRDELGTILQHPENIISIISSNDNEMVDSLINYKLQNKLHVTDAYTSDIGFKSLERINNITEKFMKIEGLVYTSKVSLNRKYLYNIYEKNGVNYFVVNSMINPTIDTIKSCMNSFFEKYKSNKKVVIFDFIEDLGLYKYNVYYELFEHLAKLKPEILFLLNIEKYSHLYKRYEKDTYIKTTEFISKDLVSVNRFRNTLSRYIDNNTAVFVYSKQEVV